jgi:hypothetical protein
VRLISSANCTTFFRDSPDIVLATGDYEKAAGASNECRKSGIAASTPVAMQICMVGIHHSWQIFSTDRDFSHYATLLPIQLFSVA